ncbi:MAG: XRE family transcriptional regulator [Gordonia sp. (in: high G+C Gram-positive bacteria)]|uniref:XRE family transcriptional regulator n=1 Tax=Gordonia sp. (in: high G+C Gram-positive bacteria) TaxID=84139 RepID=UPI0039E6F446
MAEIEFYMDGSLARAARHLIKVSPRTIAHYAGIEPQVLRQYEKGGDCLTPEQVQGVTDGLVHYGAVFVPEDETGGVGVRRKFTRTGVKMIETWESEGGPVADDDI